MLWPLFLYGIPAAFLSDSYTASDPTAHGLCSHAANSLSFLAPDTVMGNFTLGQAKAVDLGWNLVVGRGAQAVMAYTSYKVVVGALMRIAEVTPIEYSLFAGLVFSPTSVLTVPHLVRGVWSLRGWRPKFAMGWLLYSSILILAMPTIIDASTGYIQPQSVFYQSGNPDDEHGPVYGPTETLPSALRENVNESDYTCTSSGMYQWGFSSRWFLVLMAIIPVWFFGTYCLWMDAQHNSELTRKGRKMGRWRAVADLAEAMSGELGPHTSAYSDQQLQRALRDRPPIKYHVRADEKGLSHLFLTPRSEGRLELGYEVRYG